MSEGEGVNDDVVINISGAVDNGAVGGVSADTMDALRSQVQELSRKHDQAMATQSRLGEMRGPVRGRGRKPSHASEESARENFGF